MITATYHNMLNFVNKLFGGLGSNNLKKYENIVNKINDFETKNMSASEEVKFLQFILTLGSCGLWATSILKGSKLP